MTVALTTRGRICDMSSKTLSLLSWGFLCIDLRPFLEEDVRFGFEVLPPGCQIIYNNQDPSIYDSPGAALFAVSPNLIGAKSLSPMMSSTRPSLMSTKSPGLYNHKIAQLTGTRVVTVVGNKSLLLSEPDEPTLTSSGTRIPDLYEKC